MQANLGNREPFFNVSEVGTCHAAITAKAKLFKAVSYCESLLLLEGY